MNRQMSYLSLVISGLISVLPCSARAGEAGLEIVPLAVWQGRAPRSWNVDLLKELRAEFTGGRIAHAVSAAPLVRAGNDSADFRRQFQAAVLPGDDIGLHMAPWKSLATHAKIEFKFGPTLFGNELLPKACESDCGLDLGFSAFNRREAGTMIRQSRDVLEQAGFGKLRAVYFEEGVAPEAARNGAADAGMSEDWSGISSVQLTSSLARFPVALWNQELMKELPLSKTARTTEGILNLDHVRFAIHSEIGDLDSVKAVLNSAIDAAKSGSRMVRVPIVFNVDDLIHTNGFVREAVRLARKAGTDAGLKTTTLTALNKSWKFDNIAATDPIPVVAEKPPEKISVVGKESEAPAAAVVTEDVKAASVKPQEASTAPAVATVVEAATEKPAGAQTPSSDEPDFVPQDEMESLGEGSASVIAH